MPIRHSAREFQSWNPMVSTTHQIPLCIENYVCVVGPGIQELCGAGADLRLGSHIGSIVPRPQRSDSKGPAGSAVGRDHPRSVTLLAPFAVKDPDRGWTRGGISHLRNSETHL